MASDLAGKRVLVTGSSRGIGRAIAEALHRDGARVVVHARTASAETTSLLQTLGSHGALVTGDLSVPGTALRVWAESVEAFGGIDVLINNAGAWLPSPLDPVEEWSAGWQRNLALNLQAPADLCRSAILHFRSRSASGNRTDNDGGIIVNMTSRSAHRGDDAHHLAYGAAKGGLLALTKGIARGYAAEGVLTYAVSPGWVATDLADGAIDESQRAALPLGEVTPASDVAETVVFLAGGRARHATGTTIDITGADYVR